MNPGPRAPGGPEPGYKKLNKKIIGILLKKTNNQIESIVISETVVYI